MPRGQEEGDGQRVREGLGVVYVICFAFVPQAVKEGESGREFVSNGGERPRRDELAFREGFCSATVLEHAATSPWTRS